MHEPDDNPYRPTAAMLAPREPGEPVTDGTPARSHIEIRARERFTSEWIVHTFGLRTVLAVVLCAAFVAHTLGALSQGTAVLRLIAWLAILLPLAWLSSRHQGDPLDGCDLGEGGYRVDLRFAPRLPLRRFEWLDTADDLGRLRIEDGSLVYVGDRVRMCIVREDVEYLLGHRAWTSTESMHGPEMEIRLREPLAGQAAFRVWIRERIHGIGTIRRGHALRRELEAWMAGRTAGG